MDKTKKKVLIVTPHLIVGGVEKALLNMLKKMPRDEYDIYVRFVKFEGGLTEQFPKDVKYDEIKISNTSKTTMLSANGQIALKKVLKKLKFVSFSKMILKKTFKRDFPLLLDNFKKIPKDNTVYDAAVCYHMHMPFLVAYVSEKINAKEKICWVHNDFSTTGFEVSRYDKYLKNFNEFNCVSKTLSDELKSLLPSIESNIKVLYNFIDEKEILEKSNQVQDTKYSNGVYKILSVGRLNHQKGFDFAVEVATILKEKNIKFQWFIVGEGEDREKLTTTIEKNKLKEHFILIGVQKNPYYFMNNCDLYVQPSRHEGYVTTVTETKVFNKTIVATHYAGIEEQFSNYPNSKIVKFDKEDLANAIIEKYNISEVNKND